jgi:vancomycin resistance protein YoaR
MEDNRRQPNQQKNEPDYSEVILEPIQDIGLPKKRTNGNSLSRKRKKRKQQQRMIIVLGVVFALVLSFFIFMFISNQRQAAAEAAAQIAAEEAARAQQEQERQEFEALANSVTFLEGITVNDIPIGGMTMDEARTALAAAEANIAARKEVQLVHDNKLFPLDLSNMPISLNIDSVLKEAYTLGKMGDLPSMKTEITDVKINGRAFTLSVSYNLTTLQSEIAKIATQIDIPAQDAQVSGIDEKTRTLKIKNEVVGYVVDQPALITLVSDAINNSILTPIQIPIVEVQPSLTAVTLQGQFVLRASATTDFSTSASTRKYNVRKGAGMINGTVLKPGEEFSTNDTLGVRSTKNGWKMANAYESGAVVPQAGGGVCQLSSTLYNAVVKGDLEIVYRRNHSMPVAYIKEGLDATINSVGNIIDFKFKNNTTSDIIIIGYTTNSNKLTFEVWGIPFATTEYDEIKLTSSLVSTTSAGGEPVEIEVPVGAEKADGTLMVAGETFVAITPRDGYVYQSYKNYYLAGTLVRKEKLAVSTYKAFQGEIWICLPEPTSTPEFFEITPEPVPIAVPTTSP